MAVNYLHARLAEDEAQRVQGSKEEDGLYKALKLQVDPRKVFHSFRHAFKSACRAARIEEELHDALTGHTTASVGRRYGGGVPLEVLAEAIARVSYRGLDLSHLR